MDVKKVAALVVVALVAGWVFGSFGVADALDRVMPAGSAACSSESAACNDCDATGACPTEPAAKPAQGSACDSSTGACGMSGGAAPNGACQMEGGAAAPSGCPDCQ